MSDWKRFGDTAVNGIYWICGTYPETDVDVDSDGIAIGVYTGETKSYVALVEIDFDPTEGGELIVSPVNDYLCGDWDESYSIDYYMEFETPKVPEEMTQQ